MSAARNAEANGSGASVQGRTGDGWGHRFLSHQGCHLAPPSAALDAPAPTHTHTHTHTLAATRAHPAPPSACFGYICVVRGSRMVTPNCLPALLGILDAATLPLRCVSVTYSLTSCLTLTLTLTSTYLSTNNTYLPHVTHLARQDGARCAALVRRQR